MVFSAKLNAQKIKVFGKVTDNLQSPLPYANILTILQTDDLEIKLTITEQDCSYAWYSAKPMS
ncbi:hypothetical protein [Winogradskyella sp.]|uniref:hypothetical protein n=1 Tax=Winogradskyella sp. TaxID=1883156 RepID=UPI00262A7FFF|nr:hypothetical protein [Winogradskyella sp.]